MKVTFEHDQDPRYGWASIDIGESKSALIVVHSEERGSMGFQFEDGKMHPTCICSAWYPGECSCIGVDWGDNLEGDEE
jgi:hypothetical protein